MSLRLSKKCDQ